MAIVFLKRDWFDQNGNLWSARNNPFEIEDQETLDNLPSDATVDGVPVAKRGEKLTKDEKADAAEVKASGEAAVEEKEREEKLVQKAESTSNDIKHAAVETKTAKPAKL